MGSFMLLLIVGVGRTLSQPFKMDNSWADGVAEIYQEVANLFSNHFKEYGWSPQLDGVSFQPLCERIIFILHFFSLVVRLTGRSLVMVVIRVCADDFFSILYEGFNLFLVRI